MRFSIRVFFISFFALLLVVVFYSAYSYFIQLEVPLWMLQYTFYAFMTALFGFIFVGILTPLIRDRFEIGKLKKPKKRDALTALKNEYSRCQWSIENNIEKYIEKNEFTEFTASLSNTVDMGEMRVSIELQEEIKKYNEELRDYDIFRKASQEHMENSIEKKIRRMFPKTLEKNDELRVTFCSNFFMQKYFNGEFVTCNWLRDTEPKMLKHINRDIDDSEKYELDFLFNEINTEFKKEEILLRFRKQKEIIKKLGKKIISDIQKEIPSIEKQLKKYDYLSVVETQPKMYEN